MNDKNIIVHVHIFKNAGSSFDDALARNFNNNFVDHREDHLIRTDEGFLENFLRTNDKVEAFSSHSVFFKLKSFEGVRLHPIYMLRHPIERIRSVYSFEVKQPAGDSLGAKMAKQFNFQEYVSWRMQDDVPATIRNLQTVFLAGMNHHANHMDKKYEQAIKTLHNEPLIGIVDRYDESMVVFEEHLKIYFQNIDLSYVRRNVTDKNTELSVEQKVTKILNEFDETLVEKVNEKNQYDLDLYTKANALLDEKIGKIDSFEKKLLNFRVRCEKQTSKPISIVQNYSNSINIFIKSTFSKKTFTEVGNLNSDKLAFQLKSFVDSSAYTTDTIQDFLKKLINDQKIENVIIFVMYYINKGFLTNFQKNKVLVPFFSDKEFLGSIDSIDNILIHMENSNLSELNKYYIHLIIFRINDDLEMLMSFVDSLDKKSLFGTINSIIISNKYLINANKERRPFLGIKTDILFNKLEQISIQCKLLIKEELNIKTKFIPNAEIGSDNIVFIEQQFSPLITNTGTKLTLDYIFALLDNDTDLQINLLITADNSNKKFYSLGNVPFNKIDMDEYVRVKNYDVKLLKRFNIIYLNDILDLDENYLTNVISYIKHLNPKVLITSNYKEWPLLENLYHHFPLLYFSVLSGLEPSSNVHVSIFPGKQERIFSDKVGKYFEEKYIYFNKSEENHFVNEKIEMQVKFLTVAVDLTLRLDEQDLIEFLDIVLIYLQKGYSWCMLGLKASETKRIVSLNHNLKYYIENKQLNIIAYSNQFEDFVKKFTFLVQPKIVGGGRGVAVGVKNGLIPFIFNQSDAANFVEDNLYTETEELYKMINDVLDKTVYYKLRKKYINLFTEKYNKQCIIVFNEAINDAKALFFKDSRKGKVK